MDYYMTSDAWEAIAVAQAQNTGYVYIDGTTVRRVEISEYSGVYFVRRLDNFDVLGVPTVTYAEMATYFPAIE